jgi:hypothetical protein
MKYVIIKRNFLENLLDMEFKEPILNGYFYAGKTRQINNNVLFEEQFSNKLFYFLKTTKIRSSRLCLRARSANSLSTT